MMNALNGTLLRILAISLAFSCQLSFSQMTSPEDHFGFEPGSDRQLFNYEELTGYLQILDEASASMQMIRIGESPEGRPIYMAMISSEENIRNLDRLREINRELALNPELEEKERQQMIREGKVFFYATLSMHSTEVGPSQAAPAIAYELLTSTEEEVKKWLDNVVYMMVPCHNPDGMERVVEHYRKYLGTKYEGSSLPGLYHKYVGHDNNRDFVNLSQSDTRAVASVYNLEWFPQVMVEKHQMGSTGVRYFVPPPHDPIAENVDAGIWNWIGVFGSRMITDMTRQGQKGIAQHYLFDDYWPGSTETCIWKGVIGMLTEAASARIATPVYIEPNELKVWGKGLAEYKKSINMPELWPGGWWRLGDIVEYEKSSTYSILETSAIHRQEILTFRNDLCRNEVRKGREQAPYYFIMPLEQHDPGELVRIVNLLRLHGVNVYRLRSSLVIDKKMFHEGDVVVPLAQPFRAFIKEVMEAQEFPLRHYTPGGEKIRPYDITSWSLPLHYGVESLAMEERNLDLESKLEPVDETFALKEGLITEFWGMVFSARHNESYKAAFLAAELGMSVERLTEGMLVNNKNFPKGSFIVYGDLRQEKLLDLYQELTVDPGYLMERPEFKSEKFRVPRIALVETSMHDMDAGWTRFLFDSYRIPFKTLNPRDVKDAGLRKNFDVIIFPGNSKDILMEGKYKLREGQYYVSSYPPEFVKGMGKEGLEKVLSFMDEGGKIITWGGSTGLFMGTLKMGNGEDSEEFRIPVDNVADKLKDLYCPGSLVKMKLREDHPITLGMKNETGVFYRGKPVFETSIPGFDLDRRVIGWFPGDDILLSGYIENGEQLERKAGLVWVRKGKGEMVLFAFHPQFRASTAGTYKLLFNSILY